MGTCIIRCGRRLMLTTSLLDCSVWSAGIGVPTLQRILWIAYVALSGSLCKISRPCRSIAFVYSKHSLPKGPPCTALYDSAAIVEL